MSNTAVPNIRSKLSLLTIYVCIDLLNFQNPTWEHARSALTRDTIPFCKTILSKARNKCTQRYGILIRHLLENTTRKASNVHSWHTYPQASLNYKIYRKIFLNQIPMNRKALF
ncbi:hypothetical protein ACJW31_12G176600 [Castanea mollissima]